MIIQPPKKKSSDRAYYLFALRIVGDFGIAIALPAVLGAILGRYLDEKYGRSALFTIFCLIVAFLITISIVYKKAKLYGGEYQKMK
ncbi:MAG: hypothetical protein UT86_C0001G0146 [Candidatus Magasanikbacteria bacterium GW2011_GWC2_40_17]|uniref:AtpZ/AtpI family protein n=1 Tax=Candidatus Magasanikbacteria bacterium GW2011_GWA2_42_32 TaxID=1619039 RepID=A0A0G1CG14_9BACT|nr:MAG: hypothetical protein UT86_C0001G0146 [Candidatus Magasanikbacteria bacterium GW2011_GWC2_40_17]KKS57506.1 MAG: hypothetical protein UV20_C0001G0146 [Candidatus Magasanikbacteria bacterium GW2011_GWA2_42_32]OGH85222.1 MAG: hypothetical protein A2294_00555 [Candidatus Magasanikbacteria bacterium RIFOXYB2_FULL_38_10]